MTTEVVRVVRVVESLPDGFAVMLGEAAAEGVRNMALLATEFGPAAGPYGEPGALFAPSSAGS